MGMGDPWIIQVRSVGERQREWESTGSIRFSVVVWESAAMQGLGRRGEGEWVISDVKGRMVTRRRDLLQGCQGTGRDFGLD